MPNSIVHYRYAIAFLIFILIEGLTIWWYRIPDLAQLLGFGLSLSSLVLAVIAIIQALVSNNAFSGIIGSVSSSIERLTATVTRIDQAGSQLLRQTEAIPTALGEMSQQLEQAFNRPSSLPEAESEGPIAAAAKTQEGNGKSSEITNELLARATNGASMAYYVCVLGYERKQVIDPPQIFPGNPIVAFYVQGCIAGFRSCGVMDISLLDGKYLVTKLNLVDKEIVKRNIGLQAIEYVSDNKKIVDAYFGQPTQS